MQTEAIIIGAGISGLAAAKCMKDAGFKVIVLERASDIGGLWRFTEKNYGVMKFTHINVSKHNYCFSDFPISESAPDYLHNTDLYKYAVDYTKHFNLYDDIKFHRQVNTVKRLESEKQWVVTVETVEEDKQGVITPTGQTEVYHCTYLAIATGHHSKPTYPSFPGLDTFPGKAYHSVDFKDSRLNDIIDKNVVVVGIGNSAVDVAAHIAATGTKKPVYISSRSGAWVVPNYIFGSPTDHYACRLFLSLPWKLATVIFEQIISLVSGHPNRYHLNPKMHALQSQPTVSPTLIHHIQRGDIKVVSNIKRIEGKKVLFEDGTATEADELVLCTGYSIDLPFLPAEVKKNFLDPKDNSINLYKNVFAPDIGHTLAFIGFVQPASGGVLTMSEIQARWWAELCRNRIILPMKSDMTDNMRSEMDYVRKRWFGSKRHTIQKDPIIYNDEIAAMIGAKPEFRDNPAMYWRLLLGSCGPAQWRMKGPGKWDKAKEEVKKVPVTGFLFYGGIITLLLLIVVFWYLVTTLNNVLFG